MASTHSCRGNGRCRPRNTKNAPQPDGYVAGVVGAGLPAKVILLLGVANLLADGLSMAAS
ncbi:MAG: VIT1/CCC1 transporter family protein, partial [Steroidobacteraceae bacterium]